MREGTKELPMGQLIAALLFLGNLTSAKRV